MAMGTVLCHLQSSDQAFSFWNQFNADVLPVLSESDIDEVLEDIRFECARSWELLVMHVSFNAIVVKVN